MSMLKCLLCCLLLLALNKGSFQYKIYITQNEKNLISNARTVLQKLEKILNGEKLCSQGWEEYKQHCYRFNTKLIKWHEAEIECRKQEGYLLKIEDANEFRWIVARAKAHSVHDIWIGLRKKITSGNGLLMSKQPAFRNGILQQSNLVVMVLVFTCGLTSSITGMMCTAAGSAPSYVNKDEETGFRIEIFKRNKKRKIYQSLLFK